MDRNCLIGIGILAGAIVLIVAMFLDYRTKASKKAIILEKNDQKHEHKHKINEERINKLEEKNGSEQKQINDLKAQVEILKKVIYERDRKKPQ